MINARPPIPSNRASVRMCAVLLRAHREEHIELAFPDVQRCKEGVMGNRLQWPTRIVVAKLWKKHDGWGLAVAAKQTDRIPDHVRAELSA